jgi:hypothetical protein
MAATPVVSGKRDRTNFSKSLRSESRFSMKNSATASRTLSMAVHVSAAAPVSFPAAVNAATTDLQKHQPSGTVAYVTMPRGAAGMGEIEGGL